MKPSPRRRPIVEGRADRDVLVRIGVVRHAEDVLADVAEAASVALELLVAVADPDGAEAARRVRRRWRRRSAASMSNWSEKPSSVSSGTASNRTYSRGVERSASGRRDRCSDSAP